MSKEKRILIVGAGGIGMKHLRAFSALDTPPRLFALDPRPDAAERVAEVGAELLVKDWENVKITDFDGVVLCVPAPLHIPFAARCLREGVPVLSEKPLSQAWDGVEELVELSQKPGAPPSGIAYTRRYIPAHADAQKMVASGKFGDMKVMRIAAGQPFTTYRPDYKQIYYASHAQGGGCILDFTSHFIDLVQFYLGPAKSACGWGKHLSIEGVSVEDTVAMALEFESGALGTIHVNQYQPVNENIIDFCGEDACVRILEPGLTGQVFQKGNEEWVDLNLSPGDYLEGIRQQAGAFLAAIDGGPAMRTSIADAANTLRLCLDLLKNF